MTDKQNITIERKSSFYSALAEMNIVIDDVINKKLSNGQSTVVEIPQDKNELILHAQDHVFKVSNLKQIKKVVLQFGIGDIKCFAIYKDGQKIFISNKNPGAFTSKLLYIIILFFLMLSIILRHM